MIVIVGPSGSGKTTLANELLTSPNCRPAISHTTRDPRAGEVEGVDYYFVTSEVFDTLDFVETTEIYGNRYGLSRDAIKSDTSDDIFIFVSDLNGLRQIREVMGQELVLAIALRTPPSVCLSRLKARYSNGMNMSEQARRITELGADTTKISNALNEPGLINMTAYDRDINSSTAKVADNVFLNYLAVKTQFCMV